MRFAHFFIDRPVFAAVLSIVTVIVGVVAMRTLPVAQYPDIVPPTVVVTANYPGANAQTVAETVGAPIEQEINGVENMLYMSSNSTNDGQMRLTVTFALGTDLDTAQVQVQNRVAIAEPRLPEETRRQGVTVRKSSPDFTMVVQFYSPDGRYDTLYQSNFATLQVRDQLARLPGVGDVLLFGTREYSMRVWLDPQKLASRSMTAGDVVKAIRQQNVQVAAGVIGAPPLPPGTSDFQLTVNTKGRLQDPDEFGDIIVKTGQDGRVTRVRDVARVELGARDYGVNAYLNGQPAVAIAVFQLPGTNSIETADAVRAKMRELEADFPEGLEYHVPYDATMFVRESVRDVIKTLLEAVALVVLVVLVFLQSWRATLIPLLAVPVSLIGTCAVMAALGFSFNNLTLFGMVLAIGIVVDDAIVVVENVERWIEQGLAPREATYRAMTEVTPAVIAVALGLSAVFIPTAFISGITGQFYRQFALTIAVSTLISAFNSLTLSPALAAILLKPRHGKQDWFARLLNLLFGWFFRLFNRGLAAGTDWYANLVRRLVRVAALVMLAYGGLLYLTYLGFQTVPTGFIPMQDKGYLVVNLQLPDSASMERTDAVMRRLADIANNTEGVVDTFAIAGFSVLTSSAQSNTGAMFVVLENFEHRAGKPELSDTAVLGNLMAQFSQVQEGFALAFPPPPVNGMGMAGGFRMQVQTRTGHTPAELQAATEKLIAAAAEHPDVLAPAFTSFRASVPQLWAEIDRERVETQNVPMTEVADALQIYLGSLYVNDFNFLGRIFQVTAQADSRFRARPEDVRQLKVRNRDGGMVPLGAVADVRDTTGPARINRYNLFPSAEINGSAVPGVSSGEATALMERLARENLPRGMGFEWTELAYQEKVAGNSAVWIFPLCVLFVFLVHSAEYESWSLPTAIILIVPMCLLFAIAGVWLRGMDNNVFTQIGFVVLAGLSAKNAVLIVEFAKQQQERGLNRVQAAVEASRLRLRPILMTSFAFILGVLPLVWATGAGSEMRRAIGTAVFYGMLGVTLFGIFLTPVFYVVIRWFTESVLGRPTEAHAAAAAAGHDPHAPAAPPPRVLSVEPAPAEGGAGDGNGKRDGNGDGNGAAGDGGPAMERERREHAP